MRFYLIADFITLTNGKLVEEAINEMLYADDVNTKDSTIKAYIDSCYENNLIDYGTKLEDTVFCNDQSISNLGGWSPNGGSTSSFLLFNSYNRNYDLSCKNNTDKFSKNNNKAKLKYPINRFIISIRSIVSILQC